MNPTFVLALVLLSVFVILFFFIFFVNVKTAENYTNYDTKIPKIILQTSKNKPPQHVVEQFKNLAPNWEYRHFVDSEIIEFFKQNPLKGYENIIEKFNSFKNGAHKADLFRYYFLYIVGGAFVDSDAMIQKNMDDIVGRDCEFFSVNSLVNHNTVFQGFIGCVPRNEILRLALLDAYTIDYRELESEYLKLTKNLYNIVYDNKYDFKIKMFYEKFNEDQTIAKTYDEDTQEVVLIHYCLSKEIPK